MTLYLNGKVYHIETALKAYKMAEEGGYMRITSQDEDGKLQATLICKGLNHHNCV